MTPDTVTLRVLDMTFGDLHTPDGIFVVRSGLVEVPAKVAKSPYFSDAARFAVHGDAASEKAS